MGENQIYQLTIKNKESIQLYKLCYKQLKNWGNHILESLWKENMEDYKLTICSNLYKVIELIDTIEVMTENSLINSALIISRSLLESSVQLRYMIDNQNDMEKKAIILQILDIKRTAISEEEFYKFIEGKECYKNYVNIIKNQNYKNWYSYCENSKINLDNLFSKVEWNNLYKDVYKLLCIETHGVNHMENNIKIIDGDKFQLKPFRQFENEGMLFTCVIMTIEPLYSYFFKVFDNISKEDEWELYAKKLNDLKDDFRAVLKFSNKFDYSIKKV